MQYQKNQKSSESKMIHYKGYLIEAAPYQAKDSGEWIINFTIYRDTDSNISMKKFSVSNIFKIKAEAISHCIKLGKLIIDGKYENYNVEDLYASKI